MKYKKDDIVVLKGFMAGTWVIEWVEGNKIQVVEYNKPKNRANEMTCGVEMIDHIRDPKYLVKRKKRPRPPKKYKSVKKFNEKHQDLPWVNKSE